MVNGLEVVEVLIVLVDIFDGEDVLLLLELGEGEEPEELEVDVVDGAAELVLDILSSFSLDTREVFALQNFQPLHTLRSWMWLLELLECSKSLRR